MSPGSDASPGGPAAGHDLAFDALADPIRREMLAILAEVDECSAGELADKIDIVGRTAVSNHLRILRLAGLVAERRAGRYRFYSLDPSGSAADVIALLVDIFRGGLRDGRRAIEAEESSGERRDAAG